MFCSKCGKKVSDGMKFCVSCGTPLMDNHQSKEEKNTSTMNVHVQQGLLQLKGMKKNNNVVIAGIIMAILVVCIIGFGIGRRSYKQVLKEGVKSIQTESAEKLIKLFPKEFVEYVEDSYDMSYEEYCDWLQDLLESENETLVNQYGKHYKMKFQIKDVDKYSKDRLGDLNQKLYDSYGFDKKKTAKAAAKIQVEITTSGNGNKGSQVCSFEVMKIGRKWYFTTKLGGMLTPFRW